MRFKRCTASSFVSCLPQVSVSSLMSRSSGSPGNRTQRDSVISRVWATSPRLPFFKSGTSGSNRRADPPGPKPGVLPSAPVPDCFVLFQSERQRPIRPVGRSVPEPAISWPPTTRDNQASPRSDSVVPSSSPCGSRTQPTRLERPMTSPEVERAMLCALVERKVGREVLEPSSAVLQTAADPYLPRLSYQPKLSSGHEKTRCHLHL